MAAAQNEEKKAIKTALVAGTKLTLSNLFRDFRYLWFDSKQERKGERGIAKQIVRNFWKFPHKVPNKFTLYIKKKMLPDVFFNSWTGQIS
jgi:hypothetical protein